VTTTAIIPIKALGSAKGRLAATLTPPQRRELVTWMAHRVIAACRDCAAIDDILVVAGDQAAAAIGQDAGVRTMVVDVPGLGVALAAAEDCTTDAAATIVVAADLAALTSADLDAVFAAVPDDGSVVAVAPTEDGGTGALLRRPPQVIASAYGPGSGRAHRQLAEQAGVACVVVQRRGLAFDLDQPDQLAALALGDDADVPCPRH